MAGPRKKKTRAQPNLTSERVRDEALRLIEAEGLEGFSTRKLGRALGVEAMAIYWYYPSKEALLDAVVEALIAKLGSPASEGDEPPVDFIDALRRLAHAYRGLAHAYPRAFQLLATRRFSTEETYRFLDDLFTLAEHHGLDARTTARFYRIVASYCSGIALNELAGARELETRHAPKASRAALRRLASVWEWLSPEHYEDVFSFGLELLLTALREHATSRASGKGAAAAPRGKATKASSKAPRRARARA